MSGMKPDLIVGSILLIEPKRLDSGYKPEPAINKKFIHSGGMDKQSLSMPLGERQILTAFLRNV